MKNILVIGGSTGIGKSLVEILVNEGHAVTATYHQTEPESSSSPVNYVQLDVLAEELSLGFVPASLDGLVYCPGSIQLKPFHRIKPAAFQSDFELQVLGAVKIIQALLPNLKASSQSSVVLFSTVAVQMGYNFHSMVAASKGAIEGLTKSLAAEFAPAIRVNAVAPSLTDTPLAARLLSTPEKIKANDDRHPLKRIGKAEDVAEMAAFLLSDKASWITGQIMHVDGGMSTVKG